MKKKIIIVSAIILILIVSFIVITNFVGRKPFKDLDVSDIKNITINFLPPDETIVVDDKAELVSLLNNMVIYNRVSSPTEFGQAIVFDIEKNDGTKLKINSFGNKFLFIDGVAYRAEYDSSEALSSYANNLANYTKKMIINDFIENKTITLTDNETYKAIEKILISYEYTNPPCKGIATHSFEFNNDEYILLEDCKEISHNGKQAKISDEDLETIKNIINIINKDI